MTHIAVMFSVHLVHPGGDRFFSYVHSRPNMCSERSSVITVVLNSCKISLKAGAIFSTATWSTIEVLIETACR